MTLPDLKNRTLILATHNDGKLREMRDLLGPFGIEVTSAGAHSLPEPVEDGSSFEENAETKARAAANATGLIALSDDSGLCVDALEGDPGIYTADWAEKPDGSGRDFGLAMQRVESQLQALGAQAPGQRRAFFCAVLCLVEPEGKAHFFRGEAHGQLVWPPRGEKGFGYDPVFQPDGHQRTFGEMEASEKHGWKPGGGEPLSHRARAFAKFANALLV